ncbi:MAG: sugar phosphate isomerase/epimerase [Spirochaetales bacterium]|nr:sugar phosphate isomerase/epimerase [Spirochaetales bacterium]
MSLDQFSTTSALKTIAEYGFNAAEIGYEKTVRSGESAETLRDVALDLDLKLSLHGPVYNINPTSPDISVRKTTYKQIAQAIEFAAELGAETVVIHPGRLSSLTDSVNDYWEMMHEFCFFLDYLALIHNIWISIEVMENTPYEVFFEPGSIFRFMNKTWNRIKIALNCTHIMGFTAILDFLSIVPIKKVQHVYLKNYLSSPIHNPPVEKNKSVYTLLESLSYFLYKGLVIIDEADPVQGIKFLYHNYSFFNADEYVT